MIIEKHLCCQELASGIDFLFEVVQILKDRIRLRVSLRIARAADAEISLRLDISDELTCMSVLIRQREIRSARIFSILFALSSSITDATFSFVEDAQVRCANAGIWCFSTSFANSTV